MAPVIVGLARGLWPSPEANSRKSFAVCRASRQTILLLNNVTLSSVTSPSQQFPYFRVGDLIVMQWKYWRFGVFCGSKYVRISDTSVFKSEAFYTGFRVREFALVRKWPHAIM